MVVSLIQSPGDPWGHHSNPIIEPQEAVHWCKKYLGFGATQTWLMSLTLPIPSYVTLNKLFINFNYPYVKWN
jgi:hypothetical protein